MTRKLPEEEERCRGAPSMCKARSVSRMRAGRATTYTISAHLRRCASREAVSCSHTCSSCSHGKLGPASSPSVELADPSRSSIFVLSLDFQSGGQADRGGRAGAVDSSGQWTAAGSGTVSQACHVYKSQSNTWSERGYNSHLVASAHNKTQKNEKNKKQQQKDRPSPFPGRGRTSPGVQRLRPRGHGAATTRRCRREPTRFRTLREGRAPRRLAICQQHRHSVCRSPPLRVASPC